MSIFDTPDGQAVTDGDYVVILDEDGRVNDARKFVKGNDGKVDFEPISRHDNLPWGYFQDPEWMTETYENEYPPEDYDYEVRSGPWEKIKTHLGL